MRTLTEVGLPQREIRHKSPKPRTSLSSRLPLNRLLEAKMLNGRRQAEMTAALFPPRVLKVVR